MLSENFLSITVFNGFSVSHFLKTVLSHAGVTMHYLDITVYTFAHTKVRPIINHLLMLPEQLRKNFKTGIFFEAGEDM